MNSMGRIQTAYLLCARITLETTAPVFFHGSRCVFSSVSGVTGGFSKFMKNHDCSPRMSQKNRSWAKPFDHTVLGSYFMKINDILTKWILKTYFMCENYLQILYRSINNSKIHPTGFVHGRFFWTHTWWKIMIFHEFENPSWDLRTTRKHIPGPLEKHRSFASFFVSCDS